MLKTLEKLALDAKFQEETCELVFPETIDFEKVSEKYTEQMRNLLQDPSYEEEELFYRFYVGVVEQKDKLVFENEGLRYDIIIVAPGNVPEEFKKTSGHSHSVSLTGNLEYPEIYEVLEGEALFVLQKTDAKGNVVKAWAVHGKPGDKLLIPPGYGHATTNIGNGPLVFADLVADACANTYGVIANNHGMSLYIFKGENGYRIEKKSILQ